MMKRSLFCIALAFFAAGCSDNTEHKNASPAYIIYSPNAEPLNGGPLGRPTCENALAHWFDRTDANHTGTIDRSEFLTDARAQFARMDIDRNGYLVSEELDRYRAPYRQKARSTGDNPQGEKKTGNRRGRQKPGNSAQPVDQATLIDPVMSADGNLDFKVTLDEFLALAEKNFAELDADHNGSLSRDEVLAICKKKD